jgi:autotransporter translocation and assembly factor TamB
VALAEGRPEGRLSATVRLTSLKMDALDQAKAEVELDELWVGQSGAKLELAEKARATLANGRLDLPKLTLSADMPGGQRGVFDVVGSVTKLGKEAEADVTMTMRQTDLSGFKVLVPRAERLRGTLSGQLRLTGPVRNLKHRGRFLIQQGELALRGVPLTLSNFKAALVIEPDELRLEEAQASVGAGTIRAHGVVPIRGFELGESRGVVTARNTTCRCRKAWTLLSMPIWRRSSRTLRPPSDRCRASPERYACSHSVTHEKSR